MEVLHIPNTDIEWEKVHGKSKVSTFLHALEVLHIELDLPVRMWCSGCRPWIRSRLTTWPSTSDQAPMRLVTKSRNTTSPDCNTKSECRVIQWANTVFLRKNAETLNRCTPPPPFFLSEQMLEGASQCTLFSGLLNLPNLPPCKRKCFLTFTCKTIRICKLIIFSLNPHVPLFGGIWYIKNN